MSLALYAKEVFAMHFAFDEFAHILLGVEKPRIVMTDSKALTRFFQSYASYGFVVTRRSSWASWLPMYRELKIKLPFAAINQQEKIHLKPNGKIPVHRIEIDLAAKTPKQDDDERTMT